MFSLGRNGSKMGIVYSTLVLSITEWDTSECSASVTVYPVFMALKHLPCSGTTFIYKKIKFNFVYLLIVLSKGLLQLCLFWKQNRKIGTGTGSLLVLEIFLEEWSHIWCFAMYRCRIYYKSRSLLWPCQKVSMYG